MALMSWTLWLLGDADASIARTATAIQRADEIDHPHSQAYACYYASVLHALRGELTKAQSYADRCLALSDEHGFRQWRGLAHAVRGICSDLLSPSTAALEEVHMALDEYRSAGYQLGITALYVLLCPALLANSKREAALDLIEQGLAMANHNCERIFEAELYRLKAHALLIRGAAGADTEAQSFLEQALALAKSQHAKAIELRAAKTLAALWVDQGRHREAIGLLAPVYASFTQGFDTLDLIEAKALLNQLQ
jgi:predicted ATPase